MLINKKNKNIAVVTGATGGLGSAISERLGAEGYVVFAHYWSSSKEAETLQDKITDKGGECVLVRADLTHNSGVDHLVAAVSKYATQCRSSQLSVLVNNAAKLLGPSFYEATPEVFDLYQAINVRAPFFLAQRLSKQMVGGGSIVNISSASAHFSSPGDIVYAMSKAGLESLTVNMAEAVSGRGIRVNTVIPGFTDNGHPAFQDNRALQYMDGFSVLGGVGDARDAAEAVAFLISDRARRCTGIALDISGGSTIGARRHAGASVKDHL